jgi:hypothetical protein
MMLFPREFFDLNLRFAHKAARVLDLPIEDVLRCYTHLYIRFRLGRDLDASQPRWQEYLAGMLQAEDSLDWTYQFYLRQMQTSSERPGEHFFGCFSYTIWSPGKIRLHFHNAETEGVGPLSKERSPARLAELTEMFAFLHRQDDPPRRVVGGSWLYNIPSYRRLFPQEFLASAHPGANDFPYLALWGQFLDHRGQIKSALAADFIRRLSDPDPNPDLQSYFPYPVLYLESAVEPFYQFYSVRPSKD